MFIHSNDYLTGIPPEVTKFGLCKTLMCRRLTIHLKHIQTEIFVRRIIDIEKELKVIGWSVVRYMEYLTNKLRRIYKISRQYQQDDPDNITKQCPNQLLPHWELYSGLKRSMVLDFDGVITMKV